MLHVRGVVRFLQEYTTLTWLEFWTSVRTFDSQLVRNGEIGRGFAEADGTSGTTLRAAATASTGTN